MKVMWSWLMNQRSKEQVISKSTSDIMLDMMESVVMKGTGTNAYVPGYR